jgi:hypothetical protein
MLGQRGLIAGHTLDSLTGGLILENLLYNQSNGYLSR